MPLVHGQVTGFELRPQIPQSDLGCEAAVWGMVRGGTRLPSRGGVRVPSSRVWLGSCTPVSDLVQKWWCEVRVGGNGPACGPPAWSPSHHAVRKPKRWGEGGTRGRQVRGAQGGTLDTSGPPRRGGAGTSHPTAPIPFLTGTSVPRAGCQPHSGFTENPAPAPTRWAIPKFII